MSASGGRSRRRPDMRVIVPALCAAVTVAAILAASASPASTALSITSSLDGKRVLPLRIHWTADPSLPPSSVVRVDFLIDGRLGWSELRAPYFYGDDGNWLVTTFLKPGEHRFTVRVTTATGKTASDTATARVGSAPAPPASLAGTWQHTVTAADVAHATSSQPPPTGRWKLKIGRLGWQMTDPQDGGGAFDVAYLPHRRIQMRPTIEMPPYPNPSNGGFCADTDPLATWTAKTSPNANTMTLRPSRPDRCGDRIAILAGVWHRTP
jgi:hypothetical protein